jgi:hypothetical protein
MSEQSHLFFVISWVYCDNIHQIDGVHLEEYSVFFITRTGSIFSVPIYDNSLILKTNKYIHQKMKLCVYSNNKKRDDLVSSD